MANIFDSDIQVDFSPIQQDLAQRGRKRLLSQFTSCFPQQAQIEEYRTDRQQYWQQQGLSDVEAEIRANNDVLAAIKSEAKKHFNPVLAQVMNAIGQEFSECYQAFIKIMEMRTLAKAQGVNLDILGVLVGQTRMLYDYAEKNWFAPDSQNKADYGVLWTENAPLYGDIPADDAVYRQLILSKIFKNHAKSASAPEIRAMLRIMVGSFISFIRIGPMEARVAVSSETELALVRAFCKKIKTNYIDSTYMMPFPPDARIDEYILIIPVESGKGVAFTPDDAARGADAGRAATIGSLLQ